MLVVHDTKNAEQTQAKPAPLQAPHAEHRFVWHHMGGKINMGAAEDRIVTSATVLIAKLISRRSKLIRLRRMMGKRTF